MLQLNTLTRQGRYNQQWTKISKLYSEWLHLYCIWGAGRQVSEYSHPLSGVLVCDVAILRHQLNPIEAYDTIWIQWWIPSHCDISSTNAQWL